MADYIDREALRDALWDANAATMRGIAIVNTFPSADVAPVRRGRWLKKHDDVRYWLECSECAERPLRDQWKQEWLSHYCPCCGALMTKEESVQKWKCESCVHYPPSMLGDKPCSFCDDDFNCYKKREEEP